MKPLKAFAIGAEIVIVASLTIGSYNAALAGKDGLNWMAAAPLAIVLALETLRIPTALNLIRANIFTMLLSVALIIGLSLITMESASVSFESLIYARALPVASAERDLEKIMIGQRDIDKDAKEQSEKIARLTADLQAARQHREDIGNQKPELQQVAPDKTCYRPGGTKKHPRQIAYNCNSQAQNDTAKGNKGAQDAHNAELASATDQVVTAEKRLADVENEKVDTKATDEALEEAKRKVAEERATNPMYRVAAAWMEVPVQRLTAEQFETVKHYAVLVLSAAAAFVTSLIAIISSLPDRGKSNGKLVRMIRARLAAKRKTLRRIDERVRTEFKDRTKLVYVPVDAATGKMLDPAFQPKPDLKIVS